MVQIWTESPGHNDPVLRLQDLARDSVESLFKIRDTSMPKVADLEMMELLQCRFEGINLDLEKMDVGTESRISNIAGEAGEARLDCG